MLLSNAFLYRLCLLLMVKLLVLTNNGLVKYSVFLEKNFKVREGDFQRWEEQTAKEIEEAVRFAEKAPFPAAECLYEDVYA